MQPQGFVSTTRRHWRLVIVGALVLTAFTAVFLSQSARVFESTSQVFVSTTPGRVDSAAHGADYSAKRVPSYVDVANGLDFAQRIVDELGLDRSAAQVAAEVEVVPVVGTAILEITVTDADPGRAQRINRATVAGLQRYITELETPPGARGALLRATVVDAPDLPSVPVSHEPVRTLFLALILGALIGAGLGMLRDLVDTSVKEPSDVPEIAAVPVLARISEDRTFRRPPLAEGFRLLRANLQFVGIGGSSKAIVVTSALSAEGRSTTAINLALCLKAAGQSVVLVDTDLRHTRVARTLGLEGSVGVSSLLVGTVGLDDAVQVHARSGLPVVTSGVVPPNPAELLQTHAMAELIAALRSRYDVVIFDAPPLLPVTDAALLAARTDGALLVIRHGKPTRSQVREAAARLDSVGARALGVVLNMTPRVPRLETRPRATRSRSFDVQQEPPRRRDRARAEGSPGRA